MFLKAFRDPKNADKCRCLLGEQRPSQANATTHRGLLGIPSNFHPAKNHKHEDFSICRKVNVLNDWFLGGANNIVTVCFRLKPQNSILSNIFYRIL